jgi:predicted nucleic acid-binding protein
VKRVFVDTSAFFAHLVAEDAHRQAATSLLRQALAESWELHTTNAVVFETYTLLLKRARGGRELALAFLDDVEAELCAVARVLPEDEAQAITILRGHDDKAYSFCDALSFAVMERLGLQEAIAFDRDFRSYGRLTLL